MVNVAVPLGTGVAAGIVATLLLAKPGGPGGTGERVREKVDAAADTVALLTKLNAEGWCSHVSSGEPRRETPQ